MKSIERIMSAMTGSTPDYQPFTLLLSLYGASLLKCDTRDYYRDPNLWFEGQKAVVEHFDPDIMISPFSLPLEAEAFGSEIIMLNKFAPNVRKPIIKELSDIDKIQMPDCDNSPSLHFMIKTSALLAQSFQGKKAIASLIPSPVDLPGVLMGAEMWVDTLLFYPKEVEKILKITTEHFVRLGNTYLQNGTTFLVVSANFANPTIITEKIFNFLLPHLQNAFSQIKGPIVVHHGGCKIVPFIDRYATLPNVAAMVIEHAESFAKAREIVGDKMVLMGNIDGPNLINLSPESAKEKTLKILNDRKNDRHFIFASSNADIAYDTPIETIMAVVDTIKQWRIDNGELTVDN